MAYEAAGTAIAAAAAGAASLIKNNWNKIKSWFGSKKKTYTQFQQDLNNVNSIILSNATNPATKRLVNWNQIGNFISDLWDVAGPYISGSLINRETQKDSEKAAIAAQQRQYEYELAGLGVQNEYNLQNMAQQYKYNLQLQTQDQEFQKTMSNTAHQREVADLRAAGLNPILSANNGATTPSGAALGVGMGQAGDIGVGLTNEYNQKIAGWQTALQMVDTQNRAKAAVLERMGMWQQIAEMESRTQKNIADRNYTELMHNLGKIQEKYANEKENREIEKIKQEIDYSKGMLSVQRTLANIEQQRADIAAQTGYTAQQLNKNMADYYEHLKRGQSLENLFKAEGKLKGISGGVTTNFGIGKFNMGVSENHSYNKY